MAFCWATALFCEDIRREHNGQETIVGIFPDNIAVEGVPTVIPKMAVYLRVHSSLDFPLDSITLRLLAPNGEELASSDAEHDLIKQAFDNSREKGADFAGIVMRFVLSPVHVQTTGRFRASIRINGDETAVGTLNILLRNSTGSSASSPPSEQSPPADQG